LILDGVEDLVDGEPERGEVLCRFEDLKRTWYENSERMSLVGGLLPIWFFGSDSSFILRLGLFSVAFGGVVGGALHWRGSSLLPLTGCRDGLGIRPHSSE